MQHQASVEPRDVAPVSTQPRANGGAWLRWTALAWAIAVVAFHLIGAAKGRPIYRYIHIGEALGFARHGINLLKPMIIGWNLNGTPTPQDLPLWQAAVALLFKLFGVRFGLGNLVSLSLFFSCLYPLFRLAERFGPSGCGWWTLLLFLAQPIVFVYAGMASSDGFALALAVWFMFFAVNLMEQPGIAWLIFTTLAGALASVTKLPFFMAAGLGCVFVVAAQYRRQLAVWIWLGIAALLSAAAFIAWESYANHCNARAQLPYEDLTSAGSAVWFFGDLKYRLSPGVWVTGGWRVLSALFGSFALAGFFVWACFDKAANAMARGWLVGGMLTTLVFFHLVLMHHHYYLMFGPPVAVLSAGLARTLEQKLEGQAGWTRWSARTGVILALALSTVQGLAGVHVQLFRDEYPYAMARIIQQYTRSTDKLVMQGGDLTGELLLLSNRDGLSVYDLKALDDLTTYRQLKAHGFTKLIMVSESPLLAAVKRSTKTHLDLHRLTYQTAETPLVGRLPTVLQNEDILIKELP